MEHKVRLGIGRGVLTILAVIPGALCSGPVVAHDFSGVRAKAANSIVFIHSKRSRRDGTGTSEDSYGTGFVVSGDGHVMTASHVVFSVDPDTIVVTTGSLRSKEEQAYKLETVRRDDDADVMVLQFPDVPVRWQPLMFGSSKSVATDAELYTLGFPGTDLASATGILANKHGPKGRWQTTLPINHGNSGGPIFETSGKVVAIAIAGDDGKQQVTYAVPEAYVAGLRQVVASAPKMDGLIYAVGSSNERGAVTQTFQFYESVEPTKRLLKANIYCLPEGYTVTKANTTFETKSGAASKFSIARDMEKNNCVHVKALVASDEKAASGLTRGWLGLNVAVEGVLGAAMGSSTTATPSPPTGGFGH